MELSGAVIASSTTILTVLSAHLAAATARAQDVESVAAEGDATDVVIGGSGGVAIVAGEPFESVGAGYGLQLFLGGAFRSVNEVRAGIALNSHPDDLSQDRVNVLSVYIETHFMRDVSAVTLRIGPRIAWMQVSRSIFVDKLSGFGFGGIAGAQLSVGSRGSIETAVVFTAATFGGADIVDGPIDPDDESHGAVWELRLGGAFRLN